MNASMDTVFQPKGQTVHIPDYPKPFDGFIYKHIKDIRKLFRIKAEYWTKAKEILNQLKTENNCEGGGGCTPPGGRWVRGNPSNLRRILAFCRDCGNVPGCEFGA